MYDKCIISYSDTVALSVGTSSHTSHTSHWVAALGASKRKLFYMPNQIIVFISCRSCRTVGKVSQFEDHQAKDEKNSTLQIMKTDCRYKSRKWSDITKIRLTYKFVEIRVSLNFTKSLKCDILYSDSCFTTLHLFLFLTHGGSRDKVVGLIWFSGQTFWENMT